MCTMSYIFVDSHLVKAFQRNLAGEVVYNHEIWNSVVRTGADNCNRLVEVTYCMRRN